MELAAVSRQGNDGVFTYRRRLPASKSAELALGFRKESPPYLFRASRAVGGIKKPGITPGRLKLLDQTIRQVWKDFPQPQLCLALGLEILKPPPVNASLKST